MNFTVSFGAAAPPSAYGAPSLYGPQPVVMSPQDFDLLLNRVKRAGFASQKAQEVTLACAGGAVFTSEQGRLVLQEIRGDNEQKESALALYPRTIDPWNFGQVLSEFVFKNSREPVIRSILSSFVPLTSHAMMAGGPMDPVSFSQLANRIQKGSFGSDKLLEVKLALHGKCFFSSAEIKAILEAIPQDAEQVEAALLLYARCVDPAHFGEAAAAIKFANSRQRVLNEVRNIPIAQAPYGPYAGAAYPQPAFGGGSGGGGLSQGQPSFGHIAMVQQPPANGGFMVPPPGSGSGPYGGGSGGFFVAPPGSGYGGGPPSTTQGGFGYGAPPSTTQGGFGYGAPPSTQGYVAPQPMDFQSFSQLMQRLSRGFSSDKANEVILAINGGAFFSSDQAFQILKAVSFDQDQEKTALSLYPRIVDRQNFGHSLSAISFSSTREKIMRNIR